MDEITRPHMRAMLRHWGHALDTVAGYQRELKNRMATVRYAYNTLSAVRLDGAPSSGNRTDIVERAVERVFSCEEEYINAEESICNRVTELLALKRHIDAEVARLDDIEQMILRMRYQDFYDWTRISVKMRLSDSQARAIETRAVDKLRCNINVGPA